MVCQVFHAGTADACKKILQGCLIHGRIAVLQQGDAHEGHAVLLVGEFVLQELIAQTAVAEEGCEVSVGIFDQGALALQYLLRRQGRVGGSDLAQQAFLRPGVLDDHAQFFRRAQGLGADDPLGHGFLLRGGHGWLVSCQRFQFPQQFRFVLDHRTKGIGEDPV